jgi:protein-tyrosine phosphatase
VQRVELHFHALPGVDDGPATMQESIELVRAARDDGTVAIVATSHASEVVVLELPDRVEALRRALARAEVDVELLVGAELAPRDVPTLSPRDLETIAVGPPGRRWLLLEAPVDLTSPGDLLAAAAELGAQGFAVVIAHPERCAAFQDGDGDGEAILRRELETGSRAQLNAGSLLGMHGDAARSVARRLVTAGLLQTIASDAHSAARPPPF